MDTPHETRPLSRVWPWLLTLVLQPTEPVTAAPPEAIAAAEISASRLNKTQGVRIERPAPRTPPAQSLTEVIHEVLPAETLGEIAARYNVTEPEISVANYLDPEHPRIRAGQMLTVMARDVPVPRRCTEHLVRSGENWRTIASRYGVDEGKLRAWNRADGGGLTAGQILEVWLDGELPPRNPAGLGLDIDPTGLTLKAVPPLAISVGSPSRGRLLNGAHLPENPDLYSIRRTDYAYGSTHMVTYLQLALAKLRQRSDYAYELIVSDMSRPHGGPFGHHESHRSGRDVDIWLPRTADVEAGKPPGSSHQVDWKATWRLVEALVRTGEVSRI